MGSLFTYMVKAAAGQQPAPYTDDQYQAWLLDGAGFDSKYYHPAMEQRIFDDEKKYAQRFITSHGGSVLSVMPDFQRAVANVRNQQRSRGATYIKNTLSQGGTLKPWAVDHLQKGYGITNDLLKDKKFQEYISAVDADNQSDVKNAFRAVGIILDPKTSDYRDPAFIKALQEGIRAGKWKPAAAAPKPTAQPATAPAPQPAAAAPKPATAPVQAPAIPEGTHVVTGPDGKKYISSNADSKAQTAEGIGAALKSGQNPFAGVSTAAPGASGPTRVTMEAGQAAVRNQINSNIASGQSMYSNMGDVSKFMTDDQRKAMAAATNEAKPYESSGLRMVGHSANGKTQTYVGRSGRGRITTGVDAGAGHYRGAGVADTNPRSNYANLRQPTTTSPVTPPNVRKSTTAPRR